MCSWHSCRCYASATIPPTWQNARWRCALSRSHIFSCMCWYGLPDHSSHDRFNSEVCTGFMPPLAALLGAGSFGDSPGSRRFAHLLDGTSSPGNALGPICNVMQRDLGEIPSDSLLAATAAEAVWNTSKVQAALIKARGRTFHCDIDDVMRRLLILKPARQCG